MANNHQGSVPRGISKTRFILALIVAGLSDLVSLGDNLFMPLQWGIDFLTAFLLFIIFGWRWALLPALFAEAIPGLAIFPTWLLVVGAYGFYLRTPVAKSPLQTNIPYLSTKLPEKSLQKSQTHPD